MTPENEMILKEIFLVVLDLPESVDVQSLRRINNDKWDSLATVSLVAAIESELGLQLDTQQQERLTSYQATTLLLEELGK
ncbi:MAG: acyl carrier protein [Alphaproteobacteria bacterium]|uniref:acyl carrier protein n=1 Tax=Roseibium sp. TaxID=1936156 RepID=UPI0032828AC3